MEEAEGVLACSLPFLPSPSIVAHASSRTQGGTYRKILHLPKDVTYRLLVSTSPNEDLAQSDEDRILGRSIPVAREYKEADGELKEGESLALQVELTLGSSTCAYHSPSFPFLLFR